MGAFMKVVAAGARLACNAGSTPSVLTPTTASPITVEGKAVATIFDGKPFTNILPFGTCKIKGGECVPMMPGPWVPSFPTGVSAVSAPMLGFDAVLPCAVGGLIRVTDCNQASMLIGGPGQPELKPGLTPEQREASDRHEQFLIELSGSDEARRIQEEELARRVTTSKDDESRTKADLDEAARQLAKAGRGFGSSAAGIEKRRQELRDLWRVAQLNHKHAREARERAESSFNTFRNRAAIRTRTRGRR
jgi:hypothetical protein